MQKKVHLTIPEPCHENWNQMTPQDKGRFCGSCQKQVVDFTTMTDQQLIRFFTEKKEEGSVCGRFHNDQLQRDIITPRKTIPWVKYFFQIALPAFLVSAKAQAQGKIKSTVENVRSNEQVELIGKIAAPIEQSQKTYLLQGRITDSKGNGISFASVFIKELPKGVMTDSAGYYRISVRENQFPLVLVISSLGYDSEEFLMAKAKNETRDFKLRDNSALTGELVVTAGLVAYNPKAKEIPLISQLKDTIKHLFKLYPNPAMNGTNINIEWKGGEEGYYQLNIADASGRLVHQQEIWIDADARLLNFDLPKLSPGQYIFSFVNKKSGKVNSEKLLVH